MKSKGLGILFHGMIAGLVVSSFSMSANAATEFEGIAKLSGCSGSLVIFKNQSMSDPAMIMTNDHCVYDQPYNEFMLNRPYQARIRLYNKEKQFVNKVFETTRIIYAVQTDTDLALLELADTYENIYKNYGVMPLVLEDARANLGDSTLVITGYFGQALSCKIDGYVHQLVESSWTWRDSYRYSGCNPDHGTSGSPIVLEGTRKVVGINNTGNDDGEKCTLNNPCEIDERGNITVHQGISYGQRIDLLYTCLDARSHIDLKVPGCKMLGGDSRTE